MLTIDDFKRNAETGYYEHRTSAGDLLKIVIMHDGAVQVFKEFANGYGVFSINATPAAWDQWNANMPMLDYIFKIMIPSVQARVAP